MNSEGTAISLEQFADISYGSGPTLLERRDKSPAVFVSASVVGRPTGTVAAEWEEQFSQLERQPGVVYVWGGNMENQRRRFWYIGNRSFERHHLILFSDGRPIRYFATPFIVIFSVPLSFIGALMFLALTNQTLNIFTILGLIMLIGLVTKNAILLVDFANLRKQNGDSTHDALVAANHARLRPILMTTIAMVFGMVPIAMATGDGADMNRGLAIVIIGGLLSSLFLNTCGCTRGLFVIRIDYNVVLVRKKKLITKH